MPIRNTLEGDYKYKTVQYPEGHVVESADEVYILANQAARFTDLGVAIVKGQEIIGDLTVVGTSLDRACSIATLVVTSGGFTLDITEAGAPGEKVIVRLGTGATVREGLSYDLGFTLATSTGALGLNNVYIGHSEAVAGWTPIVADGAVAVAGLVALGHGLESEGFELAFEFDAVVQKTVLSVPTLIEV